tara:strand:- start:94 stop:306 length:213 start_codon:yes stop_codon:yes gene_type:complete
MTKSVKTINVERVKEMVNHYLKHSSKSEYAERLGECFLLEAILMETKNYKGFRYLETDEVEGAGTRRFYT